MDTENSLSTVTHAEINTIDNCIHRKEILCTFVQPKAETYKHASCHFLVFLCYRPQQISHLLQLFLFFMRVFCLFLKPGEFDVDTFEK